MKAAYQHLLRNNLGEKAFESVCNLGSFMLF